MNREIKFRVWDDKLNRFDIFNLYNSCYHLPKDIEDKVQQFTGLKDNNDNEIYEGDILEHHRLTFDYETGDEWRTEEVQGEVIFRNGCFGIIIQDIFFTIDKICYFSNNPSGFGIIDDFYPTSNFLQINNFKSVDEFKKWIGVFKVDKVK